MSFLISTKRSAACVTERKLLEVVDEIQRQLLLPEKSTTAQIRKEMMTWQQQASGPSKDG